MIEDVLAEYAAGGFVVSNTFQKTAADGAFGPVGWDVYIRNVCNTRTGHGSGDTMEAALREALRIANEGPTYVKAARSASSEASRVVASRRSMFAPSPLRVTLGGESDESDSEEELF